MIQNREFVQYKIFFKTELKKTKDFKLIIELLGVEVKTSNIEQDKNYFTIKIVALYAWKLLIFDRLFSEGAELISIKRLES